MTRTRQQLLENFDEEVHEKLRVNLENSRTCLNRYERMRMDLTRYELRDHAEFVDGSAFRLKSCPFPGDIPLGLYELPRRSGEAHLCRLGHPLAAQLIQAKNRELPVAEITFDYAAHDARISILESILGCTGWLQVTGVTVEALDQAEDHLLFTAFTDENVALDNEQARRLFSLPAVMSNTKPAVSPSSRLADLSQSAQDTLLRGISARNAAFFEAEAKKLDAWADDQIASAERALTDTKRRIRDLRNQAGKAPDLDEQARLQTEIRDLERRQRKLRQEIFDVEDQILAQRDQLLEAIRGKLQQSVHSPASVHGALVAQWFAKGAFCEKSTRAICMTLMANEPTMTISASANFDKLKGKLRELFELDKADLDFGIYRILRQRHAEITEFLDKHLEKTVHEALGFSRK